MSRARATALALSLFASFLSHSAAADGLVPVARLPLPDGVRMRTIAFSGDGTVAAVQGSDDRARLYALPSGELRATLESGDVSPVALSSDGRWLATGSRSGAVTILATTPGTPPRVVTAGSRRASHLLFSPDDTLLAVGRGGAPAELREVASGKLRGSLPADFGGTAAMTFSADGRLLATADEDTTVRIYRTDTGLLRTKIDVGPLEPFALDFTPDGRTLVVGGAERALLLVDPEAGTVRRRLPQAGDPVGGVAVLPGGRTAAAAYFHADRMSTPAPVFVWNLESGESRRVGDEIRVAGGGRTRERALLVATLDGGTVVVSELR